MLDYVIKFLRPRSIEYVLNSFPIWRRLLSIQENYLEHTQCFWDFKILLRSHMPSLSFCFANMGKSAHFHIFCRFFFKKILPNVITFFKMILRDASNSIIGLIVDKFKVGVILSSKLVIFKAEYHFKYQHGIYHDKKCLTLVQFH